MMGMVYGGGDVWWDDIWRGVKAGRKVGLMYGGGDVS